MFKPFIKGITVAVLIIVIILFCGMNVVDGIAGSVIREIDETLRVYEMELRKIDCINSYFAQFS